MSEHDARPCVARVTGNCVHETKRCRVERIVRAQSSNSCHLLPSPGAPPCKNGCPPLRPSSGPNFLANFWDAVRSLAVGSLGEIRLCLLPLWVDRYSTRLADVVLVDSER